MYNMKELGSSIQYFVNVDCDWTSECHTRRAQSSIYFEFGGWNKFTWFAARAKFIPMLISMAELLSTMTTSIKTMSLILIRFNFVILKRFSYSIIRVVASHFFLFSFHNHWMCWQRREKKCAQEIKNILSTRSLDVFYVCPFTNYLSFLSEAVH